jgi:hypothetical protein
MESLKPDFGIFFVIVAKVVTRIKRCRRRRRKPSATQDLI